jgi:hypothetical protein
MHPLLCCCTALAGQENYFFDGPGRELSSKRVVLRLRFYDTDKKAVLTLKVRTALLGLVTGRGRACCQALHAHASDTGCVCVCVCSAGVLMCFLACASMRHNWLQHTFAPEAAARVLSLYVLTG